jgi:hypothetical protein
MSANGNGRSTLFEYAIIYQPKERTDANGNDTTPPAVLLVEPTRILVRDEKEAGIQAARRIPDEYLSKLDEVEIALRPF